MKTLQMISGSIGLVAVAALTVNAQAAPCFENNSPFETEVWHMERGQKMKYSVVKAGGRICADEDRAGYVGVAVKADEPPFVAQVAAGVNGLVKFEKDSGGYFLVSFDGEGTQVMRAKMSQPRN